MGHFHEVGQVSCTALDIFNWWSNLLRATGARTDAHPCRDHGPLLHFRVGLQHFVVIGSPEIERELLSRRANKYSSRPPSKVGEIISGGRRTVLLPYGERWRVSSTQP